MSPPRVLVIGGPTAAGKTAVAVEVAARFGADVLCADAMTVYRGLDIGTAKPSMAERRGVPHHALDVVEPTGTFDAADFAALGEALLAQGRRLVVAGGTSLYIRSLIRGLVGTPAVDAALRAELELLADPHAELARVDPALAARLHPRDRVRVVRGLEVYRQTGQRLSALQLAHAVAPDRVPARGLWLDRADLRARIDRRLGQMMEAGYLEEVRGLLAAGVPRAARPMQSLGYRHLADHLVDGVGLDEALRKTSRDTWQLARKQRNWMRSLGFARVEGEALDAALAAASEVWPGG